MARTKASVGAKISSGKSSKARCCVAPPTRVEASGSSDKGARSSTGGNPVCQRETPKWQKPITGFFINNKNVENTDTTEDEEPSGSKQKPKRPVIESDSEEENERPKNRELDETIDLEPLTGENSHKIEEYFQNNNKGKGIGKKTKNKENMDSNKKSSDIDDKNKRRTSKRDLIEDDSERVKKKIKVI